MDNQLKNHLGKRIVGTLAIPVIVAVVLLALCALGGRSMIDTALGFNNFVSYTAIVMITTMALSINLNSGRFDFSLGAIMTLSSVIGAKISYAVLAGGAGSAPLMFVITVISGMVLGLLSGVIYVSLGIPPIITSLGVTLIYEGITFTITQGRYLMTEVQNSSMAACRNTWIYSAIVIAAVLALIIYIFDHTRFGCNYRALKEGQKVAVDTGIREVPNAIACYTICGGLMGVVGFLYAVRTTNIDTSALNFGSIGIMFTAFLPMFIGGYISRFSNEKLGFFLAALCMSMLNSTFAVFSNEIKASTQSIINAVLLVLFLIYLSNEHRIKALLRPIRK
jgi:ribose transport system permease protein